MQFSAGEIKENISTIHIYKKSDLGMPQKIGAETVIVNNFNMADFKDLLLSKYGAGAYELRRHGLLAKGGDKNTVRNTILIQEIENLNDDSINSEERIIEPDIEIEKTRDYTRALIAKLIAANKKIAENNIELTKAQAEIELKKAEADKIRRETDLMCEMKKIEIDMRRAELSNISLKQFFYTEMQKEESDIKTAFLSMLSGLPEIIKMLGK